MAACQKLYVIALFFILTCANSLLAQEFLKGKLIDGTSGEPISFATVKIKNKAIGVVSNNDGSFKIPVRFKTFGDTLVISSLGYHSKLYLLSAMIPDSITFIKLEPAVESLEEVVVYSKKERYSVETIVEKALLAIDGNTSKIPFSYVGYYRDYQRKKESYLNLNEATIAVFDQGFSKNDFETTQSSIYRYQRNENFERDSVAELPYDYKKKSKVISNASMASYGGNEFVILRIHDAIRNYKINSYSFVDILEMDFTRNHVFKLEKDVFLNDEPLYRIHFSKDAGKHYVKGKLIISKEDFKIHKMEYSVYTKASKELFFNVEVSYEENEGLMYPQYISFNNLFEIYESPQFQIRNYYLDFAKECFRIDFTAQPSSEDARFLKNFNFRYKGKKVKWKRVEFNGNSVFLYPKLPKNTEFEEVYLPRDGSKGNFECTVKPIKDVRGNVLNQKSPRKIRQYREFFVQQLELKREVPTNMVFMDKNKPIFSGQPIFDAEGVFNFWMNTPLKKTPK